MKFFTSFIFLFLSLKSFSIEIKSFKIQYDEKKQNFFLNKDNKTISLIQTNGGTPRIDRLVSPNENYYLVVYYSGSAGTTSPTYFYDAAVFNKDNEFQGIIPYSVENNKTEFITLQYKQKQIIVLEDKEIKKKLDVK